MAEENTAKLLESGDPTSVVSGVSCAEEIIAEDRAEKNHAISSPAPLTPLTTTHDELS